MSDGKPQEVQLSDSQVRAVETGIGGLCNALGCDYTEFAKAAAAQFPELGISPENAGDEFGPALAKEIAHLRAAQAQSQTGE